jgi:predicted transcriptional regulator of viral defense system
MRALDAYMDLRRFRKPVFTTEDAALRMRVSPSAASRTLGRLAGKGLILSLRHGLWALDPDVDPMLLPDYLTAPLPAYVSLFTALHHHGMIEQIPQVIYAVSPASTRRIATSIATFSVHRVVPEFFGGYATDPVTHVKMATPEKALLDVLYLSAARSRLFARLPEVELPRAFDPRACRRWIRRIPAPYRRTMVSQRLDGLLGAVNTGRGEPTSMRPRSP